MAHFSDPYIKVINFSEMAQAKSRESEGAFGRPVDKVLKRYIYIYTLLKLLLESRTIASIEIMVLEYLMETPKGGGGLHGLFLLSMCSRLPSAV